MKNFFYIIFLLLSEYYGAEASSRVVQDQGFYDNYGGLPILGGDISGKNIGELMYKNSVNQFKPSYPYIENHKRHKFDFDDGNPDIHGEIERPCQAYDTFCIRKFFAEHSHCKISGRQVPDPLFRAQSNFNYPSVNMSLSQITADYTGIKDGRISEFYIDKKTDNLVIVIDFDSVSKFSNNTIVKYYLRGREPIVTNDFTGITYLLLTTTVIIPNLKNLRLDRSETYTYANTPLFIPELGPTLGVSSDPEVPLMYATFIATIQRPYLEEIFNQGVYFASLFLQYNICDFGIKVL